MAARVFSGAVLASILAGTSDAISILADTSDAISLIQLGALEHGRHLARAKGEQDPSLEASEQDLESSTGASWTSYLWSQTNIPVLTSDDGSHFSNWTIKDAGIHNNLGGAGPDSGEQSLRFYNVTSGGGQAVDLVVTSNSTYEAHNNQQNGIAYSGQGGFGVVNMQSDRDGTNSVEFLFNLFLSGTNTSIALESCYFTMYDTDGSKTSEESITFFDRVEQVYLATDHTLQQAGDLSYGLTFQSATDSAGQNIPNPKYPYELTEQQKGRAVTVRYDQRSMWKIRFSVTGGKKGRNFVFAGMSNLAAPPTSAPTPAPTADPTANPTPAPTPAPTADPTASPTPAPVPTTTFASKAETTSLAPKATTTVDGTEKCVMCGTECCPEPTTTTPCETQSCQVWADPHVSGFDNTENKGPASLALISVDGTTKTGSWSFDGRPVDVNAYDTGDFWLVKSEPVQIQARFRLSGEFVPDRAAIGAVAVGGPFLKGHSFIVEPLDGKVTFDGKKAALGSSGHSEFHVQDLLTLRQTADTVEAKLPMGVTLLLRRLNKHVDVKITMPEIPGGVDGECGNYDGISENDGEESIQARMDSLMIDKASLLFEEQDKAAFVA